MSSHNATPIDWALLTTIEGSMNAQVLRSFLEDAGIEVFLAGESSAGVYGMLGGAIGAVNVMVPAPRLVEAQLIFEDFDQGPDTLDWPPEDDQELP